MFLLRSEKAPYTARLRAAWVETLSWDFPLAFSGLSETRARFWGRVCYERVRRRRKSASLEPGRRGLKASYNCSSLLGRISRYTLVELANIPEFFYCCFYFCLALDSTSEDLSAIRKLPLSCVVETGPPGSRHTENKISIFIGVPRGFVIVPLLYMLRDSPWIFYRGFGGLVFPRNLAVSEIQRDVCSGSRELCDRFDRVLKEQRLDILFAFIFVF